LTKKILGVILRMLEEVLGRHLIKKKSHKKVNKMRITPVRQKITFGETPRAYDANTAILALQSPSAKLGFQKDYLTTKSADAVQQTNPLRAIGYKLVKTYKELTSHEYNNPHVAFLA
jgi:hypothetical protein